MVAVDWQCTGQMVLVFQEGGAADGSWNCAELQAMCSYRRTYLGQDWCIAFTGSAIGKLDPSLSISLSLSVDAVRAIPVTGTAAPDRIIGTATFADNRTASFTAVLR